MRALLMAVVASCGVANECSIGPILESTTKGRDPRHVQLGAAKVDRLLDDARAHAAAERHREALESISAYHYAARNAVGQGGVRLSYAINDWYQLAARYPPAMSALLKARDEAAEAVLEDAYCDDDFDAFSEVRAINQRIGQRARTAELFLAIADRDFSRAEGLYLVAEPELVEAGLYRQANRFLDPEGKLKLAIQIAEGLREYRKDDQPDDELQRFETDYRTRELATLAALLVANGRSDEAAAFAAKAKAAFPEQSLATALDDALVGRFPAQDP